MDSILGLYIVFCRYTHIAAIGAGPATTTTTTTLEGASGGCVNVANIALPSVPDSNLDGDGGKDLPGCETQPRYRWLRRIHTHIGHSSLLMAQTNCFAYLTDTEQPRRTKDTTQKNTPHTRTHTRKLGSNEIFPAAQQIFHSIFHCSSLFQIECNDFTFQFRICNHFYHYALICGSTEIFVSSASLELCIFRGKIWFLFEENEVFSYTFHVSFSFSFAAGCVCSLL